MRTDLANFLAESISRSTTSTYCTQALQFFKFCDTQRIDDLDKDALPAYIMHRGRSGFAYSSIRGAVTALRVSHPRLFNSAAEPKIQTALKAAKRLARPSKAKKELAWDEMEALRRHIRDKLRKEQTQTGVRDWTFFLVSYLGMFRGAEVAALEWQHISFTPEGVMIRIAKSKTDQAGAGADVRLAANTTNPANCPRALLQSLREANKTGQYVFPGPAGHISANTMRTLLQKYLTEMGYGARAKDYGLHSFRRGGASAAARNNVPMNVLKHHGRWRSDVVNIYTTANAASLWNVSQQIVRPSQH